MSTPAFTETQWLARRWWWLLATVTLAIGLPLASSVAHAAPSLPGALVLAGVGGPLLAAPWLTRLTVRVDAAGVHYRYPPMLWRWRHWPWAALRRVAPRYYSPLGDAGGWGVKGWPGDLVYNVWGPHGLQLVFGSGNRLLLGTQRPRELRATLAALRAAQPTLPIRLPPSGQP